MHPLLAHDIETFPSLGESAIDFALNYINEINSLPAAKTPSKIKDNDEKMNGIGAGNALERFKREWLPHLSGSAGPRYLGFVTGGATPASLIGDWITSTVDQNPTSNWDSEAPNLERETVKALGQWFGIKSHTGVFVTGATMSNFVGLAIGREWIGEQRHVNVSQDGVGALGSVKIFSAMPHSSVYKATSMLGLGRSSIQIIPTLPGRESIDVNALDNQLGRNPMKESIVVVNFGTVNSGDFDDLENILELKKKHTFWLHVDGAFGAFAALDHRISSLVKKLDDADSICIDLHKWMNVPYDSALLFTRRQDLQVSVFQNAAAYLGNIGEKPNFVHLTPENSRRWRALAAWFSLTAYGKQGHADIVERNISCAIQLGQRITNELPHKLILLAPVRLNIVLFQVKACQDEKSTISFLQRLTDTGQVFMTPTMFQGQWAIRAAFSNWRTTEMDVDRIFSALVSVL